MMTTRDLRRTPLDGIVLHSRVRALSASRSLALAAGISLAASIATAGAPPTSIDGNPNGDAFSMSEPSVNVAENGGSVTVTVLRQGVGAGPASVDYGTQDFSALASQDYTAVSGTLTWSDGDLTPQTVTIPIIDDTIHQGDLIFAFALDNPQGASLGVIPSEAITIIDDETGAPPASPAVPAPTLGTTASTLLGGALALVALVALRRRAC